MNNAFIQKLIADFGITKLFEQTGVSRSHLYGIQKGEIEPKFSTLEKIAEALGYRISFERIERQKVSLDDENFFRWSMSYYDAPISTKQKFSTPPEINELLVMALEKGRREADINATLPIFIFKNISKFDFDLVISKTQEKAYLGYLLNLIDHIENIPGVAELYVKIYKQFRPKKHNYLLKRSKIGAREKRQMDLNNNKIAKTWKFKTLDRVETCQERFLKWI